MGPQFQCGNWITALYPIARNAMLRLGEDENRRKRWEDIMGKRRAGGTCLGGKNSTRRKEGRKEEGRGCDCVGD